MESEELEVFSRDKASALLSDWIEGAGSAFNKDNEAIAAVLKVADLLEPCWLMACRQFGPKATPELAVSLLEAVAGIYAAMGRNKV